MVFNNVNEGVIYEVNYKAYNQLNDEQKFLINEVIRFCEENKKFPNEKEMKKKNGYVSRTRFFKAFDINTFTYVYNFIKPIKEVKPEYFPCSNCKEEKIFNEENFGKLKAGKYGLRTICKSCQNQYAICRNYREKGIIFKGFEDIDPIIWWKHFYNGKISIMPDFCSSKENIVKIIRHVILNEAALTKDEICDNSVFNQDLMKKYKIWHLYTKIHNKLEVLQSCFPEFNIQPYDLSRITQTDESKDYLIEQWIDENNFSVMDLLNCIYNTKENKRIAALVASSFSSHVDMLTWYFNKNKIMHPIYNRQIKSWDFKSKPNGYWDNKGNRIGAIKSYCEDHGINDVINDTDKLKEWVYNHFTQSHIGKILNYNSYYDSLYDTLVSAFPTILENKILFKWEWHQWNTYTHDFLIQMLRDFVIYRLKLDDVIILPKYLSYAYMKNNGYGKFNKIIIRNKMKNYFEWSILAFPEYKDVWKPEDFGVFYTSDGNQCDSYEEVLIYEQIKYKLGIDSLKAIGIEFQGEHTFTLTDSLDRWYCPDFVFYKNNEKVYIEYFGLFSDKPHNNFMKKYKNKTLRKINYYNQTGIDFIYLFPNDLDDNFKGLNEKLNNI